MQSNKWLYNYLPAILLILLAFFLRINHLEQYPPGLSFDEGLNTVDPFLLSRGAYYPIFEDHGEPEPIFKPIMALTTSFFGNEVFSYRMTSVLFGVFTIAVIYWATVQVLRDPNQPIREVDYLVALIAASVLTVSLGHITLSRALYRAIPQPIFMGLFIGWYTLAFNTGKSKYYLLSGFALAGTIHFYTAGLILPAVIAPLAIILVLCHRTKLFTKKQITSHLLALGVFLLFTLPFSVQLLIDSSRILNRTGDVALTQSLGAIDYANLLWRHLIVAGDPNPQYNTAVAPLIQITFVPFFVIGLCTLLLRIRQPASIIIGTFLILAAIPSIISNEPIHGLRIIGVYGAFPLIVGLGTWLILRLPKKYQSVLLVASIALLLVSSGISYNTYLNFWTNPRTTPIYDRDLTDGEWFFREDHRDLVRYITENHSEQSVLMPLRDIGSLTIRTWLLSDYPDVELADEDFQLPANTHLIIPWLLEADALNLETRLFGLLHDDAVTILKPLSEESYQALIDNIDSAAPIPRDGVIDFLGRTKPLPDAFVLEYAPITQQSEPNQTPIATFGDDEFTVAAWRGPDTLTGDANEEVTYFIEWQADRRLGHRYNAYLQLQTQDYQRIAGLDQSIWRWLYPSTYWASGDVIPTEYTFSIPTNLAPGAYRLVSGAYYIWDDIPAHSAIGDTVENAATLGWIKVPQSTQPTIPATATTFNASFTETFSLRAATATRQNDQINLSLYWQSIVDRPNLDATIFVHLADQENPVLAQQDTRPWNGQYPTFIWDAGETIRTEHTLTIPPEYTGELEVFVGMYTFPDLQRLEATQNGNPAADNRASLGFLADLLEAD